MDVLLSKVNRKSPDHRKWSGLRSLSGECSLSASCLTRADLRSTP
jgi:hypothetical protein